LADPQAESLTQRIAVRCYLHPLTHGETEQYIRTSMSSMRLAVDHPAISSVHHASGGIPRLINQLMDLAIEIASTKRATVVDEMCVQIAWSELQQLPSPILESELKPRNGGIEFGELDGATFDFDNEKIESVLARTPTATTDRSDLSHAIKRPIAESGTTYADIASILNSESIDCMSETANSGSFGIWSDSISSLSPKNEAGPVRGGLKTNRTTIPISPPRQSASMNDELFGDDFEDEMPVDIHPISFSSLRADPAHGELSLHEEIVQLSKVADSVLHGGVAAETSSRPPRSSSGGASPWSPTEQFGGKHGNGAAINRDAMPNPSCDVPRELADALAVVWNDDEADSDPIDDRDMLVIEEDVTVMIDEPESSFVASGAMRKPTLKVVQNYQSLFSRLRGQK
jgi:hypothetical protein